MPRGLMSRLAGPGRGLMMGGGGVADPTLPYAGTLAIRQTVTFDNLNLWSTSHCAKAADGTGLKMTHNGDGTKYAYVSRDLSASPIDVSGCHWAVELVINAGSGNSAYTYFDTIMMQMVDTNNVTAQWTLVINGNYNLYAGSVVSDVTPAIADSNPGIDLAHIKTIKMQASVASAYTYTPSLTWNKLVFYSQPTAPGLVLFGFDGGYAGQIAAGSYLNSLGMHGAYFVEGAMVNTGDGVDRMNLAQVRAVAAQCHLIANYAHTSGYWYTKTVDQKIADVNTNSAWLIANSFRSGRKFISTPGGGYGDGESVIWSGGTALVITGRVHISNKPRPSSFYTYPCPHAVGPSGSVATHNAAVDAAAADHSICIFIFHQCTGQADDITYANFCTIADYVQTKVTAGLIQVILPTQIPRYTIA